MHDAHVSCQCIVPAECLLLSAQMAPNLLLAIVVDRVFVSREIVATAELCVARLAGLGIDLLALVWPRCVVAGGIVGRSLSIVRGRGGSRRCGCVLGGSTVCLATMLLKFCSHVESRMAIWGSAGVRA